MKKIIIATLATLAFAAPVSAAHHEMEIGKYPKTLQEVEYCMMARMDDDLDLPYGCLTWRERVWKHIVEDHS